MPRVCFPYLSRQWKIQSPAAAGYAAGVLGQCLRLDVDVLRPAVGGVRSQADHARQGPPQFHVLRR